MDISSFVWQCNGDPKVHLSQLMMKVSLIINDSSYSIKHKSRSLTKVTKSLKHILA